MRLASTRAYHHGGQVSDELIIVTGVGGHLEADIKQLLMQQPGGLTKGEQARLIIPHVTHSE